MDAPTNTRLETLRAELADREALLRDWSEKRVIMTPAEFHQLGLEISEMRQLVEDLEAAED